MRAVLRVAALAMIASSVSVVGAQSFLNGSLDGPTNTFSLVPSGWSNLAQGTSDTVSTAGHPFGNGSFQGIGPGGFASSADGGTFVWSGDSSVVASALPEGIRQVVGGLTAGQQYRVSFEFTNLGLYNSAGQIATAAFNSQNYASNGRWLVFTDGVQIGSTDTVAFSQVGGQQVWQGYAVDFTANAASIEFAFAADWVSGGTHVGMGIDGISLALVPTPSVLGLLGTAGLLGVRRRR